MQNWTIESGGESHELVYEGLSATGKAKLTIDGTSVAVAPTFLKKQGFFFRYFVGEREILLRMERKDDPAQLAVDGVYYNSDQPVESDILFTLRSPAQAGHPLGVQNKRGMGNFLSYVIFTYINIALTALTAPFYFPFSAMVPSQTVEIFRGLAQTRLNPTLVVVGVVAALVMATVYLLLYALSKRFTAPIWITIVFVLLDTLVVVLFMLQNLANAVYYLIDLAFHIWVLGSLVKLVRTRAKMQRENVSVEDAE